MRVLVTGATGFIGKSLVSRLNKVGVSVVGAVRADLTCGVSFAPVIVGAINNETQWQSALVGVDVVVHLAARAHVLNEQASDPFTAFSVVNVDGSLRLASEAAAAGVKRFVFVSSVGVNGSESAEPFTELDQPAPHDAYSMSKKDAEDGLRVIAEATGLGVVIVRPPLVYGPHAPGNFGSLLRWVKNGVPLPLGAVTHNRRSLVALDNLVDLIVTCLDHPAAAGETFMVADGQDVSTTELLRMVGTVLGRPARLIPVPVGLLQFGATVVGKRNIARRLLGSLQVDASKAHKMLGWAPPVSLEEGLRRASAPSRER